MQGFVGLVGTVLLGAGTLLLLIQGPLAQIAAPFSLEEVPGIDPDLPIYQRQNVEGNLEVRVIPATLALGEQLEMALEATEPLLELRLRLLPRRGTWWRRDETGRVGLTEAMSWQEVRNFRNTFGYEPSAYRVAMNPVVIIVHPDNPLAREGLDLETLRNIFSTTPLSNGRPLRRWGELELAAPWRDRPIDPVGQDASTPLYSYFRRAVLKDADFRRDMARLPSSEAVVAAVARRVTGIGFVSLNAVTTDVAVVPLTSSGSTPVLPTPSEVAAGRYPLPRFIYLYLDLPRDVSLPAPLQALVEFVLSRDGQGVISQSGLLPLPSVLIEPGLNSSSRGQVDERRVRGSESPRL